MLNPRGKILWSYTFYINLKFLKTQLEKFCQHSPDWLATALIPSRVPFDVRDATAKLTHAYTLTILTINYHEPRVMSTNCRWRGSTGRRARLVQSPVKIEKTNMNRKVSHKMRIYLYLQLDYIFVSFNRVFLSCSCVTHWRRHEIMWLVVMCQ